MAIAWTKNWSSSDDGTIFYGSDLQDLQNDIDGASLTITGAQTISGNKTFTGQTTLSGAVIIGGVTLTDILPYTFGYNETVAVDNEIVCWENEQVYYR